MAVVSDEGGDCGNHTVDDKTDKKDEYGAAFLLDDVRVVFKGNKLLNVISAFQIGKKRRHKLEIHRYIPRCSVNYVVLNQ